MTLKSYLNGLKKTYSTKIEELCIGLDYMPYVTFMYKIRKNKFSILEKEKIASILDRTVDELFPVDEQLKVN